MKTKALVIVALAILATLMLAGTAYAGVTDDIIKDAADGTLDGNYTAAQVQAALAAVRNNPTYLQYGDVDDVLEDYLASLPSPGVQGGGLKFTGSSLTLVLAAGLGLVGLGLALRTQRD